MQQPNASAYYADLTEQDTRYGGSRGFHYGIWEEDVHSLAEALERSNEILLRGIPVTEGTRFTQRGTTCRPGPS
jgi:hypothetical protein